MYTEKPSLLLKYSLVKNTKEHAAQLSLQGLYVGLPPKEMTPKETKALAKIKKAWNKT